MDQRHIERRGFFGDYAGGYGVDREGGLRLALGGIDRGVRGGIDDQLRLQSANGFAQALGVGKIELFATEHDQLMAAAEQQLQLTADLTMLAKQKNPHGKTSASSKLRPC
ncbi:hypothetical protein SRABI70_04397 [Pseudomonas sp. Bi70]|nr:hypothetical protein SRABI70_04397 [Pseudomonas sp. Bi70]